LNVQSVTSAATTVATRRTASAEASEPGKGRLLQTHIGIDKEFLQRAITTRIGKAVEETLEANGLSTEGLTGVDWSAEATADRIVAGTTGMLGIFARQNPELSRADLIDKFEATIRGGIAKGYKEALSVLEAVESFDDSIRGLGAETMKRVDSKLDAFFAKLRESAPASPPEGPLAPAATTT